MFVFSYVTSDSFVIHPTVDNTKEYLIIDRTSEQLELASKNETHSLLDFKNDFFYQKDSLPNVDGAIQRTIHGIIGVLNLISGPHLIVITSKIRIGEINGHNIYKVQTTELIPYARNMLHLNEHQVGETINEKISKFQ